MTNCKHCEKELTHVPGRKEKSFCNVNCRNKYFYAERKKLVESAKANLVPLPADYVVVSKVSTIDENGVVKPLTFRKPSKKGKAAPKTDDLKEKIEYAKTTAESYDGPQKPPKTLDELKAMCPTDITGLDRSAWIADNRIKYNI